LTWGRPGVYVLHTHDHMIFEMPLRSSLRVPVICESRASRMGDELYVHETTLVPACIQLAACSTWAFQRAGKLHCESTFYYGHMGRSWTCPKGGKRQPLKWTSQAPVLVDAQAALGCNASQPAFHPRVASQARRERGASALRKGLPIIKVDTSSRTRRMRQGQLRWR